MDSMVSFFFAYVLGGVTFIPLILLFAFIHASLFLPAKGGATIETKKDEQKLNRSGDDGTTLKSGADALAEKFHRQHDSDVAAGYFAVCREYVPGGVNGSKVSCVLSCDMRNPFANSKHLADWSCRATGEGHTVRRYGSSREPKRLPKHVPNDI